jgi:hypothetical protein
LELYGIDPDLVTLGKIVGGGLPVGVFGGKRVSWTLLAPLGPVYQAGTLSGNPLAMAAGIATIGYLQEHAGEVYPQLEATPKPSPKASPPKPPRAGVPLTLNRVGSMWTWFFTPGPVTELRAGRPSDTAAFGRFHRAMLDPASGCRPRSLKPRSSSRSTAPAQAHLARNAKYRRPPRSKGGRKNFTGAPVICSSIPGVRCQASRERARECCAPGWDDPTSDFRSGVRPLRCAAPAPAALRRGCPARKTSPALRGSPECRAAAASTCALGPSSKVSASSPGRAGAVSAVPKMREPGHSEA